MSQLEKDVSHALMLELLLQKKITNFFENPKHVAILFPIIQNQQHKHHQKIQNIESLIPIIQETIIKNQFKQALKLIALLDHLMKKTLK